MQVRRYFGAASHATMPRLRCGARTLLRRCRRWLVPCCDRKGSSASTHIYFAWVLLCSATMILPKYQPHMTREAEYDLAIVGGGPAGSAAAIVAARGGMRVLLLERGSFPRHKVCGEF